MLNPTAPLELKDPSLFCQANFIDGKWVEADSGKTFDVVNPATGEVLGDQPETDLVGDGDQAVRGCGPR